MKFNFVEPKPMKLPKEATMPVPARKDDYAPTKLRPPEDDEAREIVSQGFAVLDALRHRVDVLENDNDALTVELKATRIDRDRLELVVATAKNDLAMALQIRDEALREVEAWRVFFDNTWAMWENFRAGHSPAVPAPKSTAIEAAIKDELHHQQKEN